MIPRVVNLMELDLVGAVKLKSEKKSKCHKMLTGDYYQLAFGKEIKV